MVELATTIWADGPSLMPFEPEKQQIRSWGTWIEQIITAFTSNGGLIYSSLALLSADLSKPANSMAWVFGDPVAANNGVYGKVGAAGSGSWTRRANLPFSFIVASDAGAGTPNAVQATTSIPVSSSALVWMNVADTNTGSPVTVSFNGGSALTMKTNSGNNVATGGLAAGMIILGIVSGSTFRILNDQVSSAIVAAAEAAQVAAEAAQEAAEEAAFYQADVSGAPVRLTTAKLKDGPISLEDCGYVSGDALPALNRAFSSGLPVLLGPKVYEIHGEPDEVVNTPFHVQGYGHRRGVLRLFENERGVLIRQSDYTHPTIVENIELQTTGQETGTALHIKYSPADSINNRNIPRCRVANVTAIGSDIFTSGWNKGLFLEDVHRPDVPGFVFTGRRSLSDGSIAQFLNAETGIEIFGSFAPYPDLLSVPADLGIVMPRIDQCRTAIKSHGEVEGLIVRTPVLVAVDVGVSAKYETIRGWTSVTDGHINFFSVGVEVRRSAHTFVHDNLLYKFQETPNDTYAIVLEQANQSQVHSNTFYNLVPDGQSAADFGEFNGVTIIDSNDCVVLPNIHHKSSKSIIIGGTSTGNVIHPQTRTGTYAGATTQLIDDTSTGSNRYIGGNDIVALATNSGVVNLSSGSPGAVAQAPALPVNRGERYLVTGNVVATKGASAGQFLTQLSRSSADGAVANFGATGVTVTSRKDVAASVTTGDSVEGILTVLSSGTMAMQLVCTPTGSGATVAANDAQLTVVRL